MPLMLLDTVFYYSLLAVRSTNATGIERTL
jgi:hypothetical protein